MEDCKRLSLSRFILSALRLSFFHLQIMEPSECSE